MGRQAGKALAVGSRLNDYSLFLLPSYFFLRTSDICHPYPNSHDSTHSTANTVNMKLTIHTADL